MAHTIRDKEKLVHRIHRLRGQVDAIEKALEQDRDCADILQTIAACRGAMNGLMAELMEEQIRSHVLQPGRRKPTAAQTNSAEGLINIVRTYLR
jgi:DNA-binding FrmR family transcriptional regulator